MSQPACTSSSIFTVWLRSVLEPDSLWWPVFAVHCWLSHMCALKVSFMLFVIGDWCVAINNGFYYLQSNNQRLLPPFLAHRKQRHSQKGLEFIWKWFIITDLSVLKFFLFHLALFEPFFCVYRLHADEVWAICLLIFQVEKHQCWWLRRKSDI